jgi:hypothetical protein
MAASCGQGFLAAHEQNITGTYAPFNPCSFILNEEGAPKICDAPAVRGSPYCARHRALCVVAPDSPEGAAILREIERAAEEAPPPTVGPMLVREMLEPVAPEEAAHSIDLPRAQDPEDVP